MKKIQILIAVAACLFHGTNVLSQATQQVTAVQYFFDADPSVGVAGNGAILPVTPTSDLSQVFNFVLPGSIDGGVHFLYFRVRDEYGRWSTAERRFFYITPPLITHPPGIPSQQIVKLQYFFDTDPGVGIPGNGAILPVTPTSNLNQLFNIVLPDSLGAGLHSLYIRTQDELGRWSISEQSLFYITSPAQMPSASTQQIVAVQYFFDTDPGVGVAGNGGILSVNPVSNLSQLVNITLPNTLGGGVHFLYLRTKDEYGRWSLTEKRFFFVQPSLINHPPGSPTQQVTAMEYYYDTDPGIGNGTPISFTPGANVILSHAIPMPNLSQRDHYLYVRAKDQSGRWSIIARDTIKMTIPQVISTVAGNGISGYSGDGGIATSANLSGNGPFGICFDPAGNLFIADNANYVIRKVNKQTGIISTYVGNGTQGFSGDGGPATSAQLSSPVGMCTDTFGNLYFVDQSNHRIRFVEASTGIISTVAGSNTFGYSGDGGPATAAKLNIPQGVAVDAAGNIYIGDVANRRIRKVNTNGIISTICGTGLPQSGGDGGPAISARLTSPRRVSVDKAGNIFVLDAANLPRIRKIDAATGIITRVAGGGGTVATSGIAIDLNLGGIITGGFNGPIGDVQADDSGNLILSASNYIWHVNMATGWAQVIAGTGTGTQCCSPSPDGNEPLLTNINFANGVAISKNGETHFCDRGSVRKIGPPNPSYPDLDGDWFGSSKDSGYYTSLPPGYIINNTDCNDNNPSVNPAATEICNGLDDDCNGLVDANDPGMTGSCDPTLALKLFIEGYYIAGGQMQAVLHNNDPVIFLPNYCDSITVSLHAATSPFDMVATNSVVLLTDGTALVQFPTSVINGSFYIVLRHRNSIETWSKEPVTIGSNTSFDFTTPED